MPARSPGRLPAPQRTTAKSSSPTFRVDPLTRGVGGRSRGLHRHDRTGRSCDPSAACTSPPRPSARRRRASRFARAALPARAAVSAGAAERLPERSLPGRRLLAPRRPVSCGSEGHDPRRREEEGRTHESRRNDRPSRDPPEATHATRIIFRAPPKRPHPLARAVFTRVRGETVWKFSATG